MDDKDDSLAVKPPATDAAKPREERERTPPRPKERAAARPARSVEPDRRRGGGLIPWLLTVALAFFLIGMVANPWFEREVRSRLPWVEQSADLGAVSARLDRQAGEIEQLGTRVAALEQRPQALGDPGMVPPPTGSQTTAEGTPPALNDPVLPQIASTQATDRLARLDARVDSIDRQQTGLSNRVDNLSAEVAGLTVRVEDTRGEAEGRIAAAERLAGNARAVLLLGRARSAFETGEPLGSLEPALQAALGPEASDEIERLAAGMRTLVRPQVLERRFARLAPALQNAAEDEAAGGFWNRLTASFADIFTIRRSGVEADREDERTLVARIDDALNENDIAGAAALFGRLPEDVRRLGARWWLDAANYARTEAVLETLEARTIGLDAVPRPPVPTTGTTIPPASGTVPAEPPPASPRGPATPL